MTKFVAPMEWESKSVMLRHLQTTDGKSLLLGMEADAPRRFYSFSFAVAKQILEVALLSSGLGPKPQAALFQERERVIVGYDTRLVWVDLRKIIVSMSREVGGAFFEFVSLEKEDEVLALHELGVCRVAVNGSLIWSLDTDVIEDFHVNPKGDLVITTMEDSAEVVVDASSGRILGSNYPDQGSF